MNKYLPSDSWKYQQSLYSSFNNQLIKGHNQGLALYDYNTDLNLYKTTDISKLDNVSFDQINKKIDENDNYFNKAKSTIAGAIEGTAEGGSNALNTVIGKLGEGVGLFIRKAMGIDGNEMLTYAGLFLLFMIIYKKI